MKPASQLSVQAPRLLRPLMSLVLAGLVGCGGGSVAATPQSASPAATPASPATSTWTLLWSDEFDGASGSTPNPAFWNHDLGNQENNGWGNHELQYYSASTRNSFLDGKGVLILKAERRADAGPCWNGKPCAYTSARIQSQGKFSFTNGKIEARIKVPSGQGIWPAFWSLGADQLPWPASGEIDIMEFVGKTPNAAYGTAHGPGYSGAQGIGKAFDFKQAVADDFHVFSIIKRPNEIIWLVDGVEYHRLTPATLPAGGSWVFERPFFLILNLAVGGDWPGSPDASTVFPAQMSVDWVRVYKEN
ncbi:glycoside hydrolase family 16 protein [Paucibacter sp. AS339]|uniref:glycoside hydrolase family 16 protein n=1 Tax=Paucibacter hankyongi TaxID=3133434 RepID=UPI0030B0B6D7